MNLQGQKNQCDRKPIAVSGLNQREKGFKLIMIRDAGKTVQRHIPLESEQRREELGELGVFSPQISPFCYKQDSVFTMQVGTHC